MAETVVAEIDRTPVACENCGKMVSSRFTKECNNCGEDMSVCSDCIQDEVTTEHDECPEDTEEEEDEEDDEE